MVGAGGAGVNSHLRGHLSLLVGTLQPAALHRVRLKPDPQGPAPAGVQRNAFFHARNSANVATSSGSARPACASAAARTAGSPARRNGLVASRRRSSKEGVGSLRARLSCSRASRSCDRGIRRFDRARRSEGSPACIRGRSTRASRGRAPRASTSDDHICAGVPSNSRPQPAANSVSPQNTRGRAADARRRTRCAPPYGRECRARRTSQAGPGRRRDRLPQAPRAAGYRFARGTEHRRTDHSREQFAIAADVVRVMMRRHDRASARARSRIEVGDHRRRIAGIDDRRR